MPPQGEAGVAAQPMTTYDATSTITTHETNGISISIYYTGSTITMFIIIID